jgi:hypothetical protein
VHAPPITRAGAGETQRTHGSVLTSNSDIDFKNKKRLLKAKREYQSGIGATQHDSLRTSDVYSSDLYRNLR